MSQIDILEVEIESVEDEDLFLQRIQLFKDPLFAVLKFFCGIRVIKLSFIGHIYHHFSFPQLLLRFGGEQ